MKRHVIAVEAMVLALGLSGLAAENVQQEFWTGWVTDTHCGAKGQSAGHAMCAKRCAQNGAKLVLLSDEGHVYFLEPMDLVLESAGRYVYVLGSMATGNVINVTSVETAEGSAD